MKKYALTILFSLLIINIIIPIGFAQEEKICAIYFTGVGCPHCAASDPIILEKFTKDYNNFVVIEYEIYQESENNGAVMKDYYLTSGISTLIPQIIIGNESQTGEYSSGGGPTTTWTKTRLEILNSAPCRLLNNEKKYFEELDINDLPGRPNIWIKDRILIRYDESQIDNNLLRDLLIKDNFSKSLLSINYEVIKPVLVPLSGKNVEFENAIKIGGWIFQWNGKPLELSRCPSCPLPTEWSECINNTKTRINYNCSAETDYKCVPYTEVENCETEDSRTKLTFTKLISLAVVDAVNPCALAVLSLMLIAILTYNPKNKKNVLLAGLAFTVSVFVMYLFYGLIIIKFFQIIQTLTSVRLWLYKILGIVAIILGIMNIKDFVKYKPGGHCTEMPLSMRPRVQKIIASITSPKGAFCVGIFVTIFLLPCTIGPYIIAGGILSVFELIETIPFLILYNIIFVLPMIIITMIVYSGITKVEDVSGWKDKNIRYLHLIAGLIMLLLGLAMFFGLV